MAPIVYESGLEPAPQDYPEVTRDGYQQYQHHDLPQYPAKPYPYPYPPPTSSHEPLSAVPSSSSTHESHTLRSPFSGSYAIPLTSSSSNPATSRSQPHHPPLARRTTICGCGLLVFILSSIIALLSAAVIALAATTGVQAQRANNAAAQLAAMNATGTTTAPAASATTTAAAVIDGGCATNPGKANKSVYTSFALLNSAQNFTLFCNRDAPSPPLLSLFTADFPTCIDACAAYSKYLPSSFPRPASSKNTTTLSNPGGDNSARNTTCTAVSFIPAWTNKGTATAGGAPGNCYLKGGQQNETGLEVPDIGVPCHAAVAIPLEEEGA